MGLIVGKYILNDIWQIKDLANKSIKLEVAEWFPDEVPERFCVSDAQVRHVLEAVAEMEKRDSQ